MLGEIYYIQTTNRRQGGFHSFSNHNQLLRTHTLKELDIARLNRQVSYPLIGVPTIRRRGEGTHCHQIQVQSMLLLFDLKIT